MKSNDLSLSVKNLSVRFDASRPLLARVLSGEGRRTVYAVEGVSFDVERGTTFALVGESGCGKSTIARAIAGINRPSNGLIRFAGADPENSDSQQGAVRRNRFLQMIFQDPHASINPRWRVGRIIAEPIDTHGLARDSQSRAARIAELLTVVGLAPSDAQKYPHQFSGGQRQRISIARALASDPEFIVCDEPTSALDVSVQAQILNLMKQLQRERGLTYLLISHNLAVVAHMADTLGVMYLGRLVEQGSAPQILERPSHPYTRLLLDTVPDPARIGGTRLRLSGEVPSPLSPPTGCTFHPRCPIANDRCKNELPNLVRMQEVLVACHAVEEERIPAYVAR